MQSLAWSNKTTNKSAVNLDQVIIIGRVTNTNSTKTTYSIVFHFPGKESTYWHYDNQCLRDQDYNQLLANYCKDISQ